MRYLITADIHLNDYSRYNITPRFRLNQFIKLAHRYVELAKENDCKELILLGDTVDKPTNRPYIVNTLYNFIGILTSYFDNIYFILGQHDLDSKTNDVNTEDTILSIFADNPKFHYMHKKLMEIDGCKLGFSDWLPDPDVSWIEGKVDYLLTHFTKSEMFGQDIDESKFGKMIHGDIHNDQVINQYISVGNPIQHDMNSQANGSCIILDTLDKSWKRIRTDEDHSRFLRIKYTRVNEDEGFSEDNLTYFIYMPPQVKVEHRTTELPSWSNIEELVRTVIHDNNLSDIHGEVLANSPVYNEINFNFQLTYLEIHGFRSVTDFKLQFDPGDRIVLEGCNGSGKSSIIKALRNMFFYNRYMKDEKSDLIDDGYYIKVGISYEGKLYEITKGDFFELYINGEAQNYNNKTQFESDLIEKLPFMQYIDLFFVMSGTQNLSSQFSDGRMIELISKFYRLDRLNAYSDKALELRDNKLIEERTKISEKTKLLGKIEAIEGRISEVEFVKELNKSDIESQLNFIKEKIQSRDKYLKWKYDYDTKQYTKKTIEDKLNSIVSWKCDTELVNLELASHNSKVHNINSSIEKLNSELRTASLIKQKLSDLALKGQKLASDVSKMESGVCPTCGAKLTSEEMLAHGKLELDKLRSEYNKTTDELGKLTYKDDESKYKIEINNLNSELSKINQVISQLNNKLSLNSQYESERSKIESELDKVKSELTSLGLSQIQPVELSQELLDKRSELESKLKAIELYSSYISELDENKVELELISRKIDALEENADRYTQYSSLTNRTGKIYESILTRLAEAFSTEEIQYRVDAGVYRNKPYINFKNYYKVGPKFREYNQLSDGQKSVCDLQFLNQLFSVKVGVLCLDEHLKHLDSENSPKASKILSKLNVNTLIISTHDPNFVDYTKKIILSLSTDGSTKYQIV